MSATPRAVLDLVERFDRNRATYRAGQYNETQLRREFLDPLFEALGWDVANRQGYAEAYKDVIHEDAIKIGGATKAPDYCFRIGGARKFFLEAKKPSVDIHGDISAAYQLRRYAWSAKLPLSVLSDFEEFAAYDCRHEPFKSDGAGVARVMFYTYSDYAGRWQEIAGIFSKEAVLKGSFDRYAESTRDKRGTAEVDGVFLKEIESWRDLLAHNLALRNPALSPRELNYAVQASIDRIIFLRICEDRGIEEYGRLMALLNGQEVYARLQQLYRQADARYNSGLFHFREEKGRPEAPDDLTLRLSIDDKPLREIIRRLYYPESPYEFSVLPADILGQVYEQFLGKVIRLTTGHRAVVEDKPEVKKAGGVYYTPTYIVDYIVRQTLGKLLEGKTPRQAAKLRILDPACGSGSFLIGAYQHLLDWHQAWYAANAPEKWAGGKAAAVYQGAGGEWRLTTGERKRILLANIHGVDIDPQAVEVTKLSLLLKVLEGENAQSVASQLRLFQERALPDLGANIRCGNSLIGPDFYNGTQMTFLDDEERYRINAFDWKAEFPGIMQVGGFDVVIGNPPYVRSQSLGAAQRQYYSTRFKTATGTYDIYVLFVEQALELVGHDARIGFILPNKFFTTDYGQGLRRLLGSGCFIQRIIDFEDAQVFAGAGTYTALLFLSSVPGQLPEYARLGQNFRLGGRGLLASALYSEDMTLDQIVVSDDGSPWTLAAGRSGEVLLRLQRDYPTFSAIGMHMFQGLKTSADKVYMMQVEDKDDAICEVLNGLGERDVIEGDMLMPVVKGEHVARYGIDLARHLYILYPYRVMEDGKANLISPSELAKSSPRAWDYLNRHRAILGARDGGEWAKRSDWYAYARSQNIGTFLGPKFLVPYMTTRLRAAFDNDGRLFFVNITTGGYGLRFHSGRHSELYLLGILNSKLLDHCIKQMTNRFRGGYFAVNKQAVERLPFRPINFSSATDVSHHSRMVALVQQMLALRKQLAAARTAHDKTLLRRQIEATDQQIDRLVYELYGLTEEEIGIVEGGGR